MFASVHYRRFEKYTMSLCPNYQLPKAEQMRHELLAELTVWPCCHLNTVCVGSRCSIRFSECDRWAIEETISPAFRAKTLTFIVANYRFTEKGGKTIIHHDRIPLFGILCNDHYPHNSPPSLTLYLIAFPLSSSSLWKTISAHCKLMEVCFHLWVKIQQVIVRYVKNKK